jgi:hypothetical protein
MPTQLPLKFIMEKLNGWFYERTMSSLSI